MDVQADELDSSFICWNPQENLNLPNSSGIIYDIMFGADQMCIQASNNQLNCHSHNPETLVKLNITAIPKELQTQQMVSGHQHSCILSLDEVQYSHDEFDDVYQIQCMGDNTYGQREVPERVRLNAGQIETMSAGPYSTCVKMKNKELICWGYNQFKLQQDSAKYKLDDMDIKSIEFFNDVIYKEDIGKYFNFIKKSVRFSDKNKNKTQTQLNENNHNVNINNFNHFQGGDNFNIDNLNHNSEANTNQQINEQFKNINNFSDENQTQKNIVESKQIEESKFFQNLANQQNIWFGPGTLQMSMGSSETQCAIKKLPLNAKNRSILSCWGNCGHNMCKIPEAFNSGGQYVSVGEDHICALKTLSENAEEQIDRSHSACWGGSNVHGQTTIPSNQHQQIDSIYAGKYQSCALRDNYSLKCWGLTSYYNNVLDGQWRSISAGGRHSCGMQGGKYKCWGNDWYGQLQQGTKGLIEADRDEKEIKQRIEMENVINNMYQGGVDLQDVDLNGYDTDDVNEQIINNIIGPENINYDDEIMNEFIDESELDGNIHNNNNNNNNFDEPIHGSTLINSNELNDESNILSIVVGWDFTCSISLSKNVSCWGLNMQGMTDVPYDSLSRSSRGTQGILHNDKHTNSNNHMDVIDDSDQTYQQSDNDQVNLNYEQDQFMDDELNNIDNIEIINNINYYEQINDQTQDQLNTDEIKNIHDEIIKEKYSDQRCRFNNNYNNATYDSHFNPLNPNNPVNSTPYNSSNQQHSQLLSSGLSHSCIVYKLISALNCLSNHQIMCWGGNNEYGQIDEPVSHYYESDGVTINSIKFNDIKKIIIDLQVGDDYTCVEYYNYNNDISKVLNNNNKVNTESMNLFHNKDMTKLLCQGNNEYGQLNVPVNVSIIYHFASGGGHVCSQIKQTNNTSLNNTQDLKLNQTMCWGSDSHGQSTPPSQLINKKVQSMSSGAVHTCVILYRYNNNKNSHINYLNNTQQGDIMWDGKLACWGLMYGDQRNERDNNMNNMNRINAIDQIRMMDRKQLIDLSEISVVPISVSAGYDHDCFVGIRGKGYCHGENEFGQSTLPE